MDLVQHLTRASATKVGLVQSVKKLYVLGWQTVRVPAMAVVNATSQVTVTANTASLEMRVSTKAASGAITMVIVLVGTSVSVVEDSKATIAQVKSVVTFLDGKHALHMVTVCVASVSVAMAGVALTVSC